MTAVPFVVDDLTVTYRGRGREVVAVKDVGFTIAPGEVLGLVGESGSGKSSVLGAITGLLPRRAEVRAGTLRLGGHDLEAGGDGLRRARRGREIAYVPQLPMSALCPTASVGRQLRWYFGERAGTPAVDAILRSMGLDVVLDRPGDLPAQFSGGQLQRLVLAIAVHAHRPALVLADEPTTTLDPTVQVQVLDLLAALRREVGFSMLFVSHDLGAVARVCDRVGVLHRGTLVEIGPTATVLGMPAHAHTRDLVDAARAI